MGGWKEKWRLKLISAKVEVEVEAELGKNSKKASTVVVNPPTPLEQ